jgi:deazaflavin-dependent oxidoreductase (nitroreductase family)
LCTRHGGTWEGRDLLLLTTKGRKTGREYTTPMVFTRDGDRLLVYASQGGAPTHPDWYLNLEHDPLWGAKIQVSRSERADLQARRINAPHRQWRRPDPKPGLTLLDVSF